MGKELDPCRTSGPDLTTPEICARFQIAEVTAQEWARKGRIRAVHLNGKHSPLRWPVAEVVKFEKRRLSAA